MTVTATTVVGGRLGPAQPGPGLSALLERFPARPASSSWTASTETRDRLAARLSVPPFTAASGADQGRRRAGLIKVLRWLESQGGDSWQQRWLASGANTMGNTRWRRGQAGRGSQTEFLELGRGMLVLFGKSFG